MERSFKLVKNDSGTRWVIGGKRQFDEETVLERATEVFWRRGFAATSVDDLVHATGLGRGSLYGAFGNKEALFIRVVDHYRAMVDELLAQSPATEPRAALEAMFERIIEKNTAADGPAGCLLTNTCTEFATLPEEARQHVLAGLADLEATFRSVLEHAADRGDLDPTADLGQLARFFVGVHQAIAVLAAAGATKDVLEGVAAVGLTAWPKPSHPRRPPRRIRTAP